MHTHSLEAWRHEHVFLGADHTRNERRTWLVVALTGLTMVVEIIAGSVYGSMALLADGWHMATHTGALTIAALAYAYARRHSHDERFAFGTGKFGDLAGYTSAVLLALIALLIAWESFARLLSPISIRFPEATAVAMVGLLVNLLSAWLLHSGSSDHHHHDHAHDHGTDDHHHSDHNLRGAYLHVMADALTSVLAILGLLAGALYGWVWMDPLIGIVGALVIARWAWQLMRSAGAVLVDAVPDRRLVQRIRSLLEHDGDRVVDLHLWRVGPGHAAAVVSVVSDRPRSPAEYKASLAEVAELSHITVEVHRCQPHAEPARA